MNKKILPKYVYGIVLEFKNDDDDDDNELVLCKNKEEVNNYLNWNGVENIQYVYKIQIVEELMIYLAHIE